MPNNDFQRRLDETLDFSSLASDPYGKSYEELEGIARSIERKLTEGQEESIKVDIVPGFHANMGQQLRVIVRIPAKQFQDTLFRAYIPEMGMPIYLDLYGEEPERCEDFQELQGKVLDFLGRIKERIASYRNYARP